MRNPIPSSIAILCLATGSLFAQGKVSFNLTTLNPVPLVSNNITGAYLDNQYLAQLFYGSSADSSTFAPVWSDRLGTVSTPFRFGVLPGVINDSSAKYTDPAKVSGGQAGYFQVRAWTASLGADYATAYANWSHLPVDPNRLLGWSIIVKVNSVADGTASPPATPSPLVGMQSFGLGIPEPSTFALGALGLAVILWRRRK